MADEEREMEEPAVEQPEEGAAPGQLPDDEPRQPVEHFGEAHMEVDLAMEPHPLEQPEGEPEPDDEPEEEK